MTYSVRTGPYDKSNYEVHSCEKAVQNFSAAATHVKKHWPKIKYAVLRTRRDTHGVHHFPSM